MSDGSLSPKELAAIIVRHSEGLAAFERVRALVPGAEQPTAEVDRGRVLARLLWFMELFNFEDGTAIRLTPSDPVTKRAAIMCFGVYTGTDMDRQKLVAERERLNNMVKGLKDALQKARRLAADEAERRGNNDLEYEIKARPLVTEIDLAIAQSEGRAIPQHATKA